MIGSSCLEDDDIGGERNEGARDDRQCPVWQFPVNGGHNSRRKSPEDQAQGVTDTDGGHEVLVQGQRICQQPPRHHGHEGRRAGRSKVDNWPADVASGQGHRDTGNKGSDNDQHRRDHGVLLVHFTSR